MKKKIAIITARGGSKRIPKKNIKDFCGKPIIAYSIETAIESKMFDEVMVSTDSKEIAEIAVRYGAKVPFMRSDVTSDDYATTMDVLLEVISEYKNRNIEFDYMCCIYPTAPFINCDKLKDAMELIEKSECEEVMPVVKYSFPPQRCNFINSNGVLEYRFPEYRQTRSQELEKWYHDAGQFYLYDVKKYLKCGGMCTNIKPIEISEMEVQDIDDEVDWKLAELKYQIINKGV